MMKTKTYCWLTMLAFCFGVMTTGFAQIGKPVGESIQKKLNTNFELTSYSPFIKESKSEKNLDNTLQATPSALLFSLDTKVLSDLRKDNNSLIQLDLPMGTGAITLTLEKYSPLAPDFKVNTPEGYVTYESTMTHFRGVIDGVPNSVVGLSISDNSIQGIVTSSEGNFNLGQLENSDLFVLYSDRDMEMPSSSFCGVTNELQVVKENIGEAGQKSGGTCVQVYMELNDDVYDHFGSTQASVDFISAVFNEVSILYSNENLTVQISEVFVWTSNSPYGTSSSTTALNDFKAYRTSYNGDLAHLVDLTPGNGGIAYVDVLCNNTYGYGYSGIYTNYQEVPTYSWTVEVITHELGHNLGSPHTQSCDWPGGPIDNCYTQEGVCAAGPAPQNGGTIMSYCHLTSHGINFQHGFGPLPGDLIRDRVASAGCLQTCGPVCDVPSNINVSNITNTSADVSWNASSEANSYNLRYREVGGSWSTQAVSGTSYSLTGLTLGTDYEVQVEAVCTELNSGYSSSTSFTTTSPPVPCGIPTNLSVSNVTEYAADLSWTTAQNAESFIVSYRQQGGAWIEVAASSTSISLSSLMDNTNYEVRVKSICSNSESDFSSVATFTTPEAVVPITYCDARGNSTSDEWIQSVVIGGLNNNSGNNGGYAHFQGGNIQFESGQSYNLTLTPGFSSGWFGANSYPEYWRVWIDLNHDGDFTDANELVFDAGGTSETTVAGSFSIPANSPGVETRMRVAMKYNGAPSSCETFGYGEVEDYDVTIGYVAPEPCNAPVQLAVGNVTTSSIAVSWNANGSNVTGYTLAYREAGGAWNEIAVSQASYTAQGLNASTTYEFKVKAECGSEESEFSAEVMGTTATPEPCNAPVQLAIGEVTSSSIAVSWSANGSNVTGYTLAYRQSGGAWTEISVSQTSFVVQGLSASTSYDFRVKAACGGDESAFSAEVSGSTAAPAPCDTPTGLAVSSVTTNSAQVSWNAVAGGQNYILEYRAAGGSWVANNYAATSTSLSGLSAATSYEVRVKAECAELNSGFSGVASFTTEEETGPPTGYCASQGNSTADEWIESFTVNGTTYTSGNNGGYADFTAYTIDLPAGSNTGITLRPGFNSGFFGPTTYPEYWRIWVDLNKDGDFYDANELVFDAGGTSTANVNGTIVIPSGASTGLTRMRISMKYNGAADPCEAFAYGEVEDFLVNITSAMVATAGSINSLNDLVEFKLVPNPAHNGSTSIRLTLTESKFAGNIQVMDLSGRVVLQREFVGIPGEEHIESIQLPNADKGVYLVNLVFDNGERVTHKLMVD